MNFFNEIPARLNEGVNTYDPDIASDVLVFNRLNNVHPYRGRLQVSTGLSLKETISDSGGGPISSLPFYVNPETQAHSLYAVNQKKIYQYDFINDAFFLSPVYTFTNEGNLPYMSVPWYDAVYVSKKGEGLVKLVMGTSALVAGAPGARYGIIANSHLFLANVSTVSSNSPTRIQWSDLYAPEDFEIREDSEADFFELDPEDKEITGLSFQRGNAVIYTRNSIWVASYRPEAQTFRFEPIYNGIGSVFHGSVIRVKDVDYFIAEDNIYMLDGLQLKAIGDKIWTFFQNNNASTGLQDVITPINYPDRHEVHWTFNRVGGGRLSIVYNYLEDKWSDRDPQDVYSVFQSKFDIKGARVIDSFNTGTIDSNSNIIDGEWQYDVSTIRTILGGSDNQIYALPLTAKYNTAVSGTINWEIETFEMFFGSLMDVKEIDRMTLFYSGAGLPNIELLVGTRDNQLDAIVWSTPIEMDDQLAGRATFHFRNIGESKLLKFKIRFNNTGTSYVTQLTNLSFHKLEDGDDKPEK